MGRGGYPGFWGRQGSEYRWVPGSSTGTPSTEWRWLQHPSVGNAGMGWIWTRTNASPRYFPCRFTSAAITGTAPRLVEGGQPLPSSLTVVKRTPGDGQPCNLCRDLFISLCRWPERCQGRRGGCEGRGVSLRAGDWQRRWVRWQVLARCREYFLFPSSSMAGSGSEPSRCHRRTARR